ncbi:MAG: beta-propeller fold lactonase family protein [Kofleriaceae bacterium]
MCKDGSMASTRTASMKLAWVLITVGGLTGCPDEPSNPRVETCNDGLDNDGDGAIDCADSYCASAPTCLCGNGQINDGEECDGTATITSCEILGYEGGAITCSTECRAITTGCFSCGDGVANGDEDCDGADLAGEDCAGAGFAGGTLACASDCTLDTSGCTAASMTRLYVGADDGAAGAILQYEIGSDGQLTPVAGAASVAAGRGPAALAAGTDGFYALNTGDNTISQYGYGADGSLAALTPATVGVGTNPLYLAVMSYDDADDDEDGDYVFVTSTVDDEVRSYKAGDTGALTAFEARTTAEYPEGVCASGNYLYVGAYEGDVIEQYEFDVLAPAPYVPLSPATVGATSPVQMVASPDGANVYALQVTGTVLQYGVGADGTLTALDPASVVAVDFPLGMTVSADGAWAAVTDGLFGSVQLFARGVDGTLTAAGAAAVTGNFPQYPAFDPSGAYLYVPNADDSTISMYAVAAGGLTALVPATVSTGAYDPQVALSRAVN